MEIIVTDFKLYFRYNKQKMHLQILYKQQPSLILSFEIIVVSGFKSLK